MPDSQHFFFLNCSLMFIVVANHYIVIYESPNEHSYRHSYTHTRTHTRTHDFSSDAANKERKNIMEFSEKCSVSKSLGSPRNR